MTKRQAIEELLLLEQHACFLFFAVEEDELSGHAYPWQPDIPLSALFAAGVDPTECQFPDGVVESVGSEAKSSPVWQQANLPVGVDLYPYIRRLLGQKNRDAGTAVHAVSHRLTDSAKKLLQGRQLKYSREQTWVARKPNRLMLKLGKAAKRRLRLDDAEGSGQTIAVGIEDVWLIQFRTGNAFLVAEVGFESLGHDKLLAVEVVEGLYHLSRFNKVGWKSETDKGSECRGFSFGHLIRALLGRAGGSRASDRLFTASYLQLADELDPGQRQKLLYRLARHYTSDYQVPDELEGCELIQPFTNVNHLFSQEGCATIVDKSGLGDEPPPEFLSQYLNNTYRRHYMPIVMLAYHEYCYLLEMTDAASFWPALDPSSRLVDQMENVRLEANRFVLCFRFSYVSRISMHNQVNQAARRALGVNNIYSELDRDTKHIDYLLHRLADQRSEKRYRWFNVVGTFGISWLTAFTLVKEMLEVKAFGGWLNVAHDDAGVWASLVGLLVGMLGAIYAGMLDRPKDVSG